MLFSANLSVLFPNYSFLDQLKLANDIGFRHVEIPNPYDYHPQYIAQELNGMKCTLIDTFNEYDGSGHAAIPGEELEFYRGLNRTTVYYYELGFQKIHINCGPRRPNLSFEEQFEKLVANLDNSAEFFEDYNMTGLIEPVCKEVDENYFLSSFDTAVEAIEKTHNKKIKLLLNVHYLHKITGDYKKNLEKYYPYAGHIRIANAENFGESAANVEVDYNYVGEFLEEKQHEDIVGVGCSPSVVPSSDVSRLCERLQMMLI